MRKCQSGPPFFVEAYLIFGVLHVAHLQLERRKMNLPVVIAEGEIIAVVVCLLHSCEAVGWGGGNAGRF